MKLDLDEGDRLIARHSSGAQLRISELSDGERNAILVTAEVLSAEHSALVLIEEPERHLHSGATVGLISALVSERADCAFVITTHDILLASSRPDSECLILHSSKWGDGSAVSWDVITFLLALRYPMASGPRFWVHARLFFLLRGKPSVSTPDYILHYFPAFASCPSADTGGSSKV